MCGRFTLTTSGEQLAVAFRLEEVRSLQPRYNIAPTEPVLAVVSGEAANARQVRAFQWGLVPSWAKDAKMAARLINARAETVQEKPSFRTALKRRRCLIVADGFYEWQKTASGKQPYFFYQPYQPESANDSDPAKSSTSHPARQPFGFAGLWEHWETGDGSVLESCTIITTDANADMQPIHNRMPVILSPGDYDLWLDPDLQDGQAVRSLLNPGIPGEIARYPVSTVVNNARHDSPDCLEPLPQ